MVVHGVIAQGYVKPLYIAFFCERMDTALKGFFGTRKGMFLVPNYNEKNSLITLNSVMYTILLIKLSF